MILIYLAITIILIIDTFTVSDPKVLFKIGINIIDKTNAANPSAPPN